MRVFDSVLGIANRVPGAQVSLMVCVPLDASKLGARDEPPPVSGLEFPGWDQCRFSADYSVCWWFGDLFRFTAGQANAVKMLVYNYENGSEEVEVERLAIAARVPGQRLDRIFKGVYGWREMIKEKVRDGRPFAMIRFKRS